VSRGEGEKRKRERKEKEEGVESFTSLSSTSFKEHLRDILPLELQQLAPDPIALVLYQKYL
jgi:hypothetical protein